ncbi:MAG: rod shape-determining protein MreD [Candidatus Omnitrophica bacterium]|nr:rod shape-determining protein MreD [Candidatus Omnitrophota bacterium]
MKKLIFIVLITFFSIFIDYTLIPIIPPPLNNLRFAILSFVPIIITNSKIILYYAVIAGLFKDILSSYPFGIYTLSFIITAYIIAILSRWIVKDNMYTKFLYTTVALILVSLIPNIWDYSFNPYASGNIIAKETIAKKIIINNIFVTFWYGLLMKILK